MIRDATEKYKRCPFCYKTINFDAEICPFCHKVLIEKFQNESDNFKKDTNEEIPYDTQTEAKQVIYHRHFTFNKKFLWLIGGVVLAVILLVLFIKPKPVTYQLGYLDTRFGLSNDEAISIINDAAQRWNNAAQKNLLKYDPHGKVTINFVYDYRQEYVDAEKKVKAEYSYLSSIESSLNAELYQVNQEKSQFNSDSLALNNDLNSLNNDIVALNKKINYWNSLGGAPPGIYEELNSERKELNSRNKELQSRSSQLDKIQVKTNEEAQDYNKKLADYNKQIDEENAKLSALYDEFSKHQNNSPETDVGEYYSNTISIYSFDDNSELRVTLMHEFGHALGCEHAQSANSIMYPNINGSKVNMQDPKPSAEDLDLLGRH